jgi:alpha-tubulin suppressor-like RCC1 family protein
MMPVTDRSCEWNLGKQNVGAGAAMAALQDLPLEVLTSVCQQLDLYDLVRVAETCKRFRHGDGALEAVELPNKSPVVTALRELAFLRRELSASTRPIGFSDSWVAYLARCARQRRFREAPPIATGWDQSLFADAAGRLLSCGRSPAVGHDDGHFSFFLSTPVAAMAEVLVRSVAAGSHSLALGWDGRVYSWGKNENGQLGHGDTLDRLSPVLVEGLEGVRGVAAGDEYSLAVAQSGVVFIWGRFLWREEVYSDDESEDSESIEAEMEDLLRPTLVEGLGEVSVRHVCAGLHVAFAIGENGELFWWGQGEYGRLGHGDWEDQPSPKPVETLRGVWVSSVSVEMVHVMSLAEDGLVYSWGGYYQGPALGNPHAQGRCLPKLVEALRGVLVGGVAAAPGRSYAVADTGELWAWGGDNAVPIGHANDSGCPLPKPIEALRGIRVDVVAGSYYHTLTQADDGSVYAWGHDHAARVGVLGFGALVESADETVSTPQRIPPWRQ